MTSLGKRSWYAAHEALADQSNDAGRCILYRPALAVAADANNAASTAAGPLGGVDTYRIHKMIAARVTTAR